MAPNPLAATLVPQITPACLHLIYFFAVSSTLDCNVSRIPQNKYSDLTLESSAVSGVF